MSDTPNIDIRPDHWQIVRDILRKHVPKYEVWAFGSRAKWLAKQYSDLDLAIITDQPLALAISAALADDFSESDLPWKVDVVDWATTGESFRKIIERDKVIVQESHSYLGMKRGWPRRQLKDCAKWYSGGTPSKGVASYWGGDIPWISSKSLTSFFVSDSEDRVTNEGAHNGTRLVPKDSILFVVRGMSLKTEFRMGVATRPVTFNQDVKALLAIDDVLPAYLAYAIKSKTNEILQMVGEAGHGTGVLPTDRIQSLEIPIPPIADQRAIAGILGNLDERIELNQRMDQTLEAMARALFKSWFVDFDGVAPEDMQESELGFIPKGWQVIAFGDVAQQVKGTVNPMTSPEETFTHYSLPAFDVAQLPVRELGEAIKSNKTPVPNECVLVSKLNPHIPRIWLIGGAGHNAVCSTEFIVWMPKKPANSAFVYVLASSSEFNSALRQLVTGTSNSHQRVKPEQLANIRVIAVNDEAISKFSAESKPLMEKLLHHRLQSQQLAQLRDTLLPKLISGEVRIKDAERLAETA